MKRAVFCLLAACGGADESPADALDVCTVELSGNFPESLTGCPTLVPGAGSTAGDMLLRFDVTSRALDDDLRIDLDLGQTPTPGVYNSGTTSLWTAMGVKGACLFLAGNNATPTGYFMLQLTAIDEVTAHGDLSLTMPVLPRTEDDGTQTDCGANTTEDVRIHF